MIYGKQDDKEIVKWQDGYLFIDKNFNRYGVCKNGKVWDITELTTGLLVNTKIIYKKKDIQSYIDEMSDAVTRVKQKFIKHISHFSELIADYERKL